MLRYASLCLLHYAVALLCCAFLCFLVLCCFVMLWFAKLCYAWLCLTVICFAMLCYAFSCFAMPCNAMIDFLCFAMLGYAWLCLASLCLAVLSFALLWFWGWPVSLSRTGRKMREIHTIYAAIWSQSQIPRKNALFDPICGGDHSRAQKVKIYNENITENHNEESRDDFEEILREILHFRWFSLKIDEKSFTKIVVRTN